jgi:hypothetical protein
MAVNTAVNIVTTDVVAIVVGDGDGLAGAFSELRSGERQPAE